MVTALCWKILLLSLPKFLRSQSGRWCSKHTKLHCPYLHILCNFVRPVGDAPHRGAPPKTQERSSTAWTKGLGVLLYSLQRHVCIFSLFVSWDGWTIEKLQFDFRKGTRVSSSPRKITSYSAQWTSYSLDKRTTFMYLWGSVQVRGLATTWAFARVLRNVTKMRILQGFSWIVDSPQLVKKYPALFETWYVNTVFIAAQ